MLSPYKPKESEKVPPFHLGQCADQLRLELHNLVLSAFVREGITRKELAARLGKDQAQISRLLGGPGNWTIDTAAQLLFGINGNVVEVAEKDPRHACPRNDTAPEWLVLAGPHSTHHTPRTGATNHVSRVEYSSDTRFNHGKAGSHAIAALTAEGLAR